VVRLAARLSRWQRWLTGRRKVLRRTDCIQGRPYVEQAVDLLHVLSHLPGHLPRLPPGVPCRSSSHRLFRHCFRNRDNLPMHAGPCLLGQDRRGPLVSQPDSMVDYLRGPTDPARLRSAVPADSASAATSHVTARETRVVPGLLHWPVRDLYEHIPCDNLGSVRNEPRSHM